MTHGMRSHTEDLWANAGSISTRTPGKDVRMAMDQNPGTGANIQNAFHFQKNTLSFDPQQDINQAVSKMFGVWTSCSRIGGGMMMSLLIRLS